MGKTMTSHRFTISLVAFGVLMIALAAGCGFTPVPQPPPMDVLNLDEVLMTVDLDAGVRRVRFVGGPKASIGGYELWIVDLDGVESPVIAPIDDDGSFDVWVPGDEGHEMRLQVRFDDQRFEPRDVIVRDGQSPERVVRADCLTVGPAFEVAFGEVEVGGDGPSSVLIENGCGGDLVVDAVSPRVALLPVVVDTTLPLTIGDGLSESVELRIEPTAAGFVEEVLFLYISGAETERWPLTWFGTGVMP